MPNFQCFDGVALSGKYEYIQRESLILPFPQHSLVCEVGKRKKNGVVISSEPKKNMGWMVKVAIEKRILN